MARSRRKSSHAIKIPRHPDVPANVYGARGNRSRVNRVTGSFYDGQRFREGTVGWEDGVIVEARAGRSRDALAQGLILPGLWNAHTHLGDAVVSQELVGSLEDLVAPPHGLKHRVLAKAKDAAVIAAMRRAVATMVRSGTTGCTDFREGGLLGLKLFYAALAALPVQGIALGRPLGLEYDAREVDAILRSADGIALSSNEDWPRDAVEKLAAHVRRERKVFALHCSERIREDIDRVLDLRPAFLVHMVHATDADLARCSDAGVPVVVCPRSNAFFGLTPDIPRMLAAGVELLLGTDNAMINVPSMLREIEFAYRVARMKGGVPAREVLRMALLGRRLADPKTAGGIRVGERADLVVLDVPGGNSGFASVVRASAGDIRLVIAGGRPWSSEPLVPPTGTPRRTSSGRRGSRGPRRRR